MCVCLSCVRVCLRSASSFVCFSLVSLNFCLFVRAFSVRVFFVYDCSFLASQFLCVCVLCAFLFIKLIAITLQSTYKTSKISTFCKDRYRVCYRRDVSQKFYFAPNTFMNIARECKKRHMHCFIFFGCFVYYVWFVCFGCFICLVRFVCFAASLRFVLFVWFARVDCFACRACYVCFIFFVWSIISVLFFVYWFYLCCMFRVFFV